MPFSTSMFSVQDTMDPAGPNKIHDTHPSAASRPPCVPSWLRRAPWIGPLLLMVLLGITPGISFHEDLGRHLLLGRIIREQRAVPRVNLLSYTHPDHPFINHHWLGAVALESAHRAIGLNGLIILKAILLACALALAMRAVPARAGPAIWLMALGAAIILGFRSHIRPELATYLGVGFFLWAFERIRRGHTGWWWTLAAALWVWSNTHIYFIFGLGMIGAFLLESRISAWLRRGSHDWTDTLRMAAVGMGFMALCALGPNGFHGLAYPFRIFANYGVTITENASPWELWQRVTTPMLLVLPWFFLGSMIAMSTVMRRVWQAPNDDQAIRQRLASVRWANLIILTTALIATLSMARSAPLAALAAMPVAASAWGSAPRSADRLQPGRSITWVLVALINLGLAWTVIDGSYARRFPSPLAPQAFGFDEESRYLALRELADKGLRGPIFNDYNIGSLVGYTLYPEPVYADNRPEAFPEAFWLEELTPALALGERWDDIRNKRDINAIIVSLHGVGETYIRELVRRPEWVLAHVDSLCAVFVMNHPRNLAFLKAHTLTDDARRQRIRAAGQDLLNLREIPWWRRQVVTDRILFDLYGLYCIGERERIWPLVLQLYRLYPDYQQVHELVRVVAPSTAMSEIEAMLERAVRYPVAAKQVTDWAYHLTRSDRPEEAQRVLQRGRWFFPLAPSLQ